MLKWLIVIGLAYLFYRLMTSDGKEAKKAEGTRRPEFTAWQRPMGGGQPPDIKGGELVEDPQCGVYVPKESAIAGPDGKWFCSRECLEAWQKKGS